MAEANNSTRQRDTAFGRSFSDHMLVADYHEGEWHDFSVVPLDALALSPRTSALHYGQSVFEGMKAHRDSRGVVHLFRPNDHFHRLNRSSIRMCMPELPRGHFIDGIRQLVRIDSSWVPHEPDQALYIRPVYFATDECLGLRVSERYTFAVVTAPVGAYHRERIALWLSRENVRSHVHGTGDIKTPGNYGAALRATRHARERGFDDVIWVDACEREYVEECGTMNIFFVVEGTVVTPPLSGTILPGITRDTVLAILSRWGVSLEERPVTVAELLDMHAGGSLEECFGTGTAAGVVTIDRIGYEDGCTLRLGLGHDCPLTTRLRAALHEAHVGRGESPRGWVETIHVQDVRTRSH